MSDTAEKQRYQLGEFEGPLDLLLFLIRRSEVNIYDIPIAQITEQYLRYLEFATRVDLENITDFYVMAATLLYIKSRMLLPVDTTDDEEFEDPRAELVERLIDYQKFKKLTDLMAEQELEAGQLLERKSRQSTLPFPEDEDLWENLEVWDLLKAFSHIMSSLTPERIIDLYEEVSINEKISLAHELLDSRSEIQFADLLVDTGSIMEVVCAFLAVLELVKQREIRVFQNKLFGDIRLTKRDVPPPQAQASAEPMLPLDTDEGGEPVNGGEANEADIRNVGYHRSEQGDYEA